MKDTIFVEVTRYHQWDNRDRSVGDRYEIPASPVELLDTLVGQGLVRVLPDEEPPTEPKEQPAPSTVDIHGKHRKK